MSLKFFEFTILNQRTGQTCAFIGQGEGIEDAFKDGKKNSADAYRANSSGKETHEHGCRVTLKDGRVGVGKLKDFESDSGCTGEVDW
jgi:hypothetical protein